MSSDFLIQDNGEPDAIAVEAEQRALEDLPVEVLIYLLGSRYCETDRLSNLAWSLFGQVPKGWLLAQAICDYVHDRIAFDYQHASPTRTAWDAHTERHGVCRDFAHLAVALCRCMNIPARYCTGYLGDIGVPSDDSAMDFSAWFEVYLGGRWHTFDARHNKPRIGPHLDGAWARCNRRRDRNLIWSVHARELQGDHRGDHSGHAGNHVTAVRASAERPSAHVAYAAATPITRRSAIVGGGRAAFRH